MAKIHRSRTDAAGSVIISCPPEPRWASFRMAWSSWSSSAWRRKATWVLFLTILKIQQEFFVSEKLEEQKLSASIKSKAEKRQRQQLVEDQAEQYLKERERTLVTFVTYGLSKSYFSLSLISTENVFFCSSGKKVPTFQSPTRNLSKHSDLFDKNLLTCEFEWIFLQLKYRWRLTAAFIPP